MFQSFSPLGQMQGMGGMSQGQFFSPPQRFIPPKRQAPIAPTVAVVTAPVVPVVPTTGTFVFTQTVASATWTINYPFVGQFPSVTVTDTAGNVVLTDVQYIVGLDRVIVTFAQPFAGVAYLNV